MSTVLDETGLRVRLKAESENGLTQDSDIDTDKVSAIRKIRVRQTIGKVSKQKMAEVSQSIRGWLDL